MPIRQSCILFFLFTNAWCGAQKQFASANSIPANAIDAEKVYLQLTGKAFNTSEVIWFKGVVANAFNNSPSDISGVLHVELIDPIDEQIVDHKLLKLENGIAENFFQLHANYPEGKYLIRAYTEWNKNFGADFIFSTYVDVFHFQRPEDKIDPIRDITVTKELNSETVSVSSMLFPNELDSLHKGKAMLYLNWENGTDSIEIKQKKSRPVPVEYDIANDVKVISYRLKTESKSYSKSIVLDENEGSLNFFPEGGALVNDIKSAMGFKYLNYKGKGAEIEGVIVDQENNELSTFKSNHLGMGKMALLPEMGKGYFGVVQSKKGTTYKYPIPMAKPQGSVMRIISRMHMKLIVLDAKPAITDSIFVKLYHRGKYIYMQKALMKKGKFNYSFISSSLPNGLIGATLYDSKHKPIAERHFYNHKPEDNLDIKVEMDKNEYKTRDSVVVRIRSTKGKQPTPSSISLMVVNKDYFEQTNRSQKNMVSYFMLESDIRGEIEKPAYYFEHEDHLKDLDYLMLTQGWTNYKYDKPQKPKITQPEKGLRLSGYVGGVQKIKRRKRFQNDTYNLALMTFGEEIKAYNQEIDTTGYFNFSLENSYGDGNKIVIQPTSSGRKSANFKVRITKRKTPEIAYETEVVIAPVDSIIEKTISERIEKDIALDPYLLPNTIALNEVIVSDYILTPEREEMSKLHGLPDVVINSNELIAKAKNWTGTLYSWLLFNYPQELSIRLVKRAPSLLYERRVPGTAFTYGRLGRTPSYSYAEVHGAGFTYILIDGIPVNNNNFSLVPDIPIKAVKSAEIIRNTGASANRYFRETFPKAPLGAKPPEFPAILAIYTYSGKGFLGAFPEGSNLLLDSAPEFAPQREFYSPAYDEPDTDFDVPDLRTLIHWAPNISTDTQGNATVKFFNGDITGKVMVICEGISILGDGIGQGEISYDIIE